MVFDGLGLDEETLAKVQAAHDADIKGLKAKNSDLIEQNKTIKADSEKTALEAAQSVEDAKLALAEREGDITSFKAQQEASKNAIESLKQEFADKEQARAEEERKLKLDMNVKEFVLQNSAGDIGSNLALEKAYRESIQVVDGEIVPVDAAKNIKEITQAIVQDDAYSKYVKLDVGSGAGAAGSNSTSGQAKSLSDMNATEEAQFANSNPEQYAQMTKQ